MVRLKDRSARLVFQQGQGDCTAACPCGEWPSKHEKMPQLAPTQQALLSQLLRDHAVGMDICLVGERGVGKTVLCRAFAEALGYRTYSVFCFKDAAHQHLATRNVRH